MADQQPGEDTPAAGLPDPSRPAAEPTHVAPPGPPDVPPAGPFSAQAEPSTVDAPMRWSGSAAVPPPAPKGAWWSRGTPAPPADEDDWASTPPQDPWADQDTPWDAMPPAPEHLPPAWIDRPDTPPTRLEPPAVAPPAASPPFAAPPPTAPPPPPPRRRWRRNRPPAIPPAPAPADRVPVAPRPMRSRPAQSRPLPPPPAGRSPARRPLPPPPRRRRRWPRTMALVTLFSVVCCCGVPAFLALPAARQYPVSAQLPDSVADLDRRDDGTSRRAAERLAAQLGDANAFAAIYSDRNGKRVTLFGTTGLRLTPQADVEAEVRQLSDEYDIRDVQSFDIGEAGVHERCGVGRLSGTSVVVCAWADHGSLAIVVLTRRSVPDSAELTSMLRSAVLARG